MFIFRSLSASLVAPLVLIEDQRHFRAGGHAVASQLLILGPHLVLFERRITRLVDWKQVWIDGVTLGMADAFGLFESNLHKVPFLTASGSTQMGLDKSVGRSFGR